ncbi:hypothetical protein V8G54_036206 [Vigna mungo]|uniref:Uncharacterized protein n=1 Tax=Vigna mungo TaxID=3915 RepID=A0AAQ3MGN7_VIGMU
MNAKVPALSFDCHVRRRKEKKKKEENKKREEEEVVTKVTKTMILLVEVTNEVVVITTTTLEEEERVNYSSEYIASKESRARKDDRPSNQFNQNILAPAVGLSDIPTKPRGTRRTLMKYLAQEKVQKRTLSASDQSTQEVRKITPTPIRSGEVRKMASEISAQRRNSYLKPLGGKLEK